MEVGWRSVFLILTRGVHQAEALQDVRLGGGALKLLEKCSSKTLELGEGLLGV